MELSDIKLRYGIIGTDPLLDQAIDTAMQVARIQLSVLIIGESGSGKEVFSKIIHEFSSRKNNTFVAVNCGGIPEGTIDSELFGHEKGAFTGAISDRKGYFEIADKGTIFLDEIGELPLSTQAKLLRVLEKGEYMRVGSSAIKRTDVRVVAATNVDLEKAIANGKFREDLFYRLNGILIRIPPLRHRKQDIGALFHKFTNDFSDLNGKNIPPVRLTPSALNVLCGYDWPGNVRQLKNVAEQITVLAKDKVDRIVDEQEILRFMPNQQTVSSTALVAEDNQTHSYSSEREILFKVLFDMRKDVTDLKKLVMELLNGNVSNMSYEDEQIIKRLYSTEDGSMLTTAFTSGMKNTPSHNSDFPHANKPGHDSTNASFTEISPYDEQQESSFSITENEKELIKRALDKHNGNRRKAAAELGISERTLFRRIHDYELDK